MTNSEYEAAPYKKLIVAEENVEDLLQELGERNPRAVHEKVRKHLAKRTLGTIRMTEEENNQGDDGREERI